MARKLTSVLLTVLLLSSLLGAGMVTAAGNVLFSQDFTALSAEDALPSGWQVAGGRATVGDGYVELSAETALLLPTDVAPQDFTYEVRFTIVRANDPSRWAGFMFRYQTKEKYLQMCCRQNAAAAEGIDCAMYSGGWQYPTNGKGSYLQDIRPDKVYTAKVVVRDNRVSLSVNDTVCVLTTALLSEAGRLGVQSRGSVVRVYGVTVSEPEEIPDTLPDNADQVKTVYEPETGIIGAPTVIQEIDSAEKLEALRTEGARTQVARFALADADLHVRVGEETYSLPQILQACGTGVLPMFTTGDKATAVAFSEYILLHNTLDVILASDNTEALAAAWDSNRTGVRYAYLAGAVTADHSTEQIARETHSACATIAVITPGASLDRASAEYLQLRGIAVWLDAASDDTQNVYEAVDCGANGVTVKAFETAYALYEKVTAPTAIRKTFLVGHRGLPSAAPENSKESYLAAVAAGADAIECDVQMTSDGVLISNHNGSVDGYTTDPSATGAVSGFTWEQLSRYTLKPVGGYSQAQFCKMEWYFQILKENPSIVGFVELKNSSDQVVKKTVALMEQMGVENQVVFICFSDAGLQSARRYAPYAATARLAGSTGGTSSVGNQLRTLMQTIGYTAAAPDYGYEGVSAELVKASRHRGVIFQTWTVNSLQAVRQQSAVGVSVITTNFSNYSEDAALTAYRSVTAAGLFGTTAGTTVPTDSIAPTGTKAPEHVNAGEPTADWRVLLCAAVLIVATAVIVLAFIQKRRKKV